MMSKESIHERPLLWEYDLLQELEVEIEGVRKGWMKKIFGFGLQMFQVFILLDWRTKLLCQMKIS